MNSRLDFQCLLVLFVSFIVVSTLFPSIAFSKIGKDYDDFDETTRYHSSIHDSSQWYSILMVYGKKNNEYFGESVGFLLLKDDWHFFAKEDLQMKIDGEIIELKFLERRSDQIGNGKLMTAGFYLLDVNSINKINNANDITIRIYMSNVSNITWDVPRHVLNEWKELIDMSGFLQSNSNSTAKKSLKASFETYCQLKIRKRTEVRRS